ncbi:MAG: hypothetical protein ACYTBS_18440, partial [Planctomycetota bacterium]
GLPELVVAIYMDRQRHRTVTAHQTRLAKLGGHLDHRVTVKIAKVPLDGFGVRPQSAIVKFGTARQAKDDSD